MGPGSLRSGEPRPRRTEHEQPAEHERETEEGPQKHVMIVRMGENALLTQLETFLHEEVGS